ncbi:Uncharacterised protein [Fusobacterium necrogenes]|uniref:Pilus assembly protein, PilO n=1 Tax=Fusobacterium necrogenes TaxID=858 RepID=A0A377GVE2_9FUSO|nr:hypothetical protein [Fusobacterium necrogenes]STO30702.1 Uncharacterised protein [Fusobacterium necrogenes]
MISLKNFNYHEYKAQILLFISIFIAGFIMYSLIFLPFKDYKGKVEALKSLQIKIKKEQKTKQASTQRYNKLLENLEQLKISQNNIEKIEKNKSFKNISSLEKFISEKANSHHLIINTIGRVEKVNNSNKIYIPYIIEGEDKDILSFLEELEKNKKKISFSDSITKISFTPRGKIITKISSNVLNTIEQEINQDSLITISKLSNKKISNIKYLSFNKKNYIILNYKDGSKNIFYEGEEVILNNLRYKIILKNNSPFLQLLEN